MKRLAVAAVLLAACSTGDNASTTTSSLVFVEGQRYRQPVFTEAVREDAIVYDRETGLALDLRTPLGDSAVDRPLIVWIHGGWFRGGNREFPSIVADLYTRMGYVTASISYRLDPDNLCEAVTVGAVTTEDYAAATRDCVTALDLAVVDTQRAVRWLQDHAEEYGIDPERIALAGLSAGGITAIQVGALSDDVDAVIAVSGCAFRPDDIDAGDAPTFLIASGFDPEIPFSCVDTTADLLRDAGVPLETAYYPDEELHAYFLYEAYADELDPELTGFLVEHLDL